MGLLTKAVVTGFGLAMGAAIFKKLAPYIKLDEKKPPTPEEELQRGDGGTDPGLRHAHS